MLNKIILMGRLTRDPDMRYTQNQTAVAYFTLAVERDFKDKQTGSKVTDFIDIVAWRSAAEFVEKYFFKGRMIVVEGRLQIREWIDRDGGKRKSVEVVANNVYFGDSKRDGRDNGCSGLSNQSNTGSFVQGSYSSSDYSDEFTEIADDEDVPF